MLSCLGFVGAILCRSCFRRCALDLRLCLRSPSFSVLHPSDLRDWLGLAGVLAVNEVKDSICAGFVQVCVLLVVCRHQRLLGCA
jgi:hypothetical protein